MSPYFEMQVDASSSQLPQVVLTDVDDTLTWEGKLPPVSLQAMYRLQDCGISLILVTGACAGWCDQMARTWPVDAVIGENGAFVIEKSGRSLIYRDTQDVITRETNRALLFQMAEKVLAHYPELKLAQDQSYRRYDLAVDYQQEVSGISPEIVHAAASMLKNLGAHASISSIHINAWLGDFSKSKAARCWLENTFGWGVDSMKSQCVYIGDSLNDEQMFQFFPRSVGVANIRTCLDLLHHKPSEIMSLPGGFGFSEWVEKLLGQSFHTLHHL